MLELSKRSAGACPLTACRIKWKSIISMLIVVEKLIVITGLERTEGTSAV